MAAPRTQVELSVCGVSGTAKLVKHEADGAGVLG